LPEHITAVFEESSKLEVVGVQDFEFQRRQRALQDLAEDLLLFV